MATTTAPTRRERDRLRRAPPVVPSATVRTRSAVILFALVAACGGDDESVPVDAPVAIDTAPLPSTPASTRRRSSSRRLPVPDRPLQRHRQRKTIAADVHEYAPRWELWSDDGAQAPMDRVAAGHADRHADMDHWSFPVGTKVWKEFAARAADRDALLQKIGPSDDWADWFAVSFQWDAGETDAMAVPAA
jgi:hypothetical protein